MKVKKVYLSILCALLVACTLFCAMPVMAEDKADGVNADVSAENKPESVTVVIASRDISRGTYITDEYLETITVPNFNLPPNYISDISEIITKYAEVNIYEGEYIYKGQLSDKRIIKVSDEAKLVENFACKDNYLVVTDFIAANTRKDLAALIQELIDENPGKTIYFPDGEYVIASPICMPAAAKKSVSLHFSDGAVLKAAKNWKAQDGRSAMICLGGKLHENNIRSVGSYYSVIGGTIDCSGLANGITVYSGRETLVKDVCIIAPKKGIVVQEGANNGSSDCDFEDITIIGNKELGSIGVQVIKYDNTFTNIRVYDVELAYEIKGGGLYKNLYAYNSDPANNGWYDRTVGIKLSGDAWLTQCTVENYATAYVLGRKTVLLDSVARWTNESCNVQTAVEAGSGTPSVCGVVAEFYGEEATTAFYKSTAETAKPVIWGCAFDESLVDDKGYESFIYTPIMPLG